MNTISPWTATAQLDIDGAMPLLERKLLNYTIHCYNTGDSFWIVAEWPKAGRMAFRAAFDFNCCFEVLNLLEDENEIVVQLGSRIGKYEVRVLFPDAQAALFHYTTTLTSLFAVRIFPFLRYCKPSHISNPLSVLIWR